METYNLYLVIFSIFISILASYASFDLIGRVRVSKGATQMVWMILSASAMGIGIWSMNYIAILGFKFQYLMTHDLYLVILSLLFAVTASFVALPVLRHSHVNNHTLFTNGLFMGLGIGSMHFISISAFTINGIIFYHIRTIFISYLIAVCSSIFTLWLVSRSSEGQANIKKKWKIIGSVLLGFSMVFMHFTAIHATKFPFVEKTIEQPTAVLIDTSMLAFFVGGTTILILFLLMLISYFDRKLALEAARWSDLHFKSLFENNLDMVGTFDLQGNIKSTNPSALQISGYALEEVINKHFQSLIAPDEREAVLSYFERSIQGEWQNFDTKIIHKNGHIFDVSITNIPIIVDGKVVGIHSIGKDITKAKQMEAALLESEAKYRLIAENMSDLIALLDHNGLITYLSPSYQSVLGYPPESFIGYKGTHFIHPEDLLAFQAWTDSIKRSIQPGQTEVRVIHATKGYVILEVDCMPICGNDGTIEHLVVIGRDITERKNTEELLRKSDKLSVIGELAAGIAHEIRNPLTAMRGFIQLLESSSKDKPEYFDIILSELDRINYIVSELLLLSKPQIVNYKPSQITFLLKNIVTLLETQAILNNVEIQTNFDPTMSFVICEENQLKQVFINILKNSIEAMPTGGNIHISTKVMGQEKILIRFVDQGCGIPPELLARLGEPFYTTKEKGTGLGLMVSMKIIEEHQGKLHIKSEVDKGTTIEITLPLSN